MACAIPASVLMARNVARYLRETSRAGPMQIIRPSLSLFLTRFALSRSPTYGTGSKS